MIKFEIYTDESNRPQSLTLYFRTIFLGSGKSSHIKILEKDVPPQALKVINSPQGVLIEGSNEFSYKINGKKIIGSKIIKENDRLSLGNTFITFKEINYELSYGSLDLESLYDDFHQHYEEYENILTAIEKELILSDDVSTR